MRRSLVLAVIVSVTLAPLRATADDPASATRSTREGAPRSERSEAAPREAAPREAAPREAVPREAERVERPRTPRDALRDIDTTVAVVGAAVGAAVLGAAYLPYPVHEAPQWRGGVLFDDSARGALRLGTPSARDGASAVSDVLVSTLVLAPVLIDAVLVTWLMRGDAELMGRMLLMNLQAHAVAQGLTTLFKHVVGRERPVARACREELGTQASDPLCESRPDPDIPPASFFSGHSSLAFTSAALICLQHTQMGLYGPEGDATMCATGMALATSVGLLRIAADRHYASDVLLGAAVGMLSGWLVPWLLHFDLAEAMGVEGASATIAPIADDHQIGVQVMGTF